VPNLPIGADPATRRAFYEHYRFTTDRGFFTTYWRRADGEYSWRSLENVAGQFPDTDALYRRAQTRNTVIGTIAAVGGGVEGFTLGYNLAASNANRMSRNEQIAFYSVGGGLVLVSLVVSLAWHDPADDFSDVYDASLRRALGLDLPPASRARYRMFAWVPEPLGDGYGYRF